jgi:tRNA pseudouridine55 synthase
LSKRRKKGNDIHGWLVLDKALGQTSTDAVNKVKRLFNANKCGHAGTLDPLATGILPIALGEATRTVAWLMEAQKTYEFTIKWGSSTTTQDAEGEVVATSDVRPTSEAIEKIIPDFLGEIEQIPPKYSAIKVDGERAYDLARDGEEFELASRKVQTFALQLIANDSVSASFFVRSGKGFYVRALARDLCQKLGAEGHIIVLRRTSVGPFKQETAITLENLEKMCIDAPALQLLLPFETALGDIPVLDIKEAEVFDLRQGRKILVLPPQMDELKAKRKPRNISGQDMSRAVLAVCNGAAIALGDVRAGNFLPFRVFQTL